jgi:predicted peroxiredoxin
MEKEEKLNKYALEKVTAKLTKSVQEDFNKAKEKGYKIYLQNN